MLIQTQRMGVGILPLYSEANHLLHVGHAKKTGFSLGDLVSGEFDLGHLQNLPQNL